MEKNNHILNNICEIQPPDHLKEAVLRRISGAKAERIRRKKMLFQFGFVFSGAVSIASGMFFGKEIATSDFWSIASLSFTDMGIILAHWQSFGLSLLETFPTVAVASMFAPVLLTLVLMKKYSDEQPMLKLKF